MATKHEIEAAQKLLRAYLPVGATITYVEITPAKSAHPTVALLAPNIQGQMQNISTLAAVGCQLLHSRALDALTCNPIWPRPSYLTAHIAQTLHGSVAALTTHVVMV